MGVVVLDRPGFLKVEHPETKEEIQAMFQIRAEEYRKRGYLATESDVDEYDENGKCVYFIAKLNGKIVGTVRLIIDDPLPTEKYFEFKEPAPMQSIPRNHRAELSRLISVAGEMNHLVLWYLIKAVVRFGQEEDLEGGYASVKRGLVRLINSIGIPLHCIKPFRFTSCNEERFNGYFHEGSPVVPVYYLTYEVAEAMKRRAKKKRESKSQQSPMARAS